MKDKAKKRHHHRRRRTNRMVPTFHHGQFTSSFNPTMRRHSDASIPPSMIRRTRDLTHGAPPSRDEMATTSLQTNFTSSSAKARNTVFTDMESRAILRDVALEHDRAKTGKKIMFEQAEKLKRLTRDRLLLSNECLTYDQLIERLLLDGEELVLDRGLHFTHTEFKDPNGDVAIKPIITEGRAYVTNKRLLLLAAEQIKGTILSVVERPTRSHAKGYQVTSYHNDELHYQYVNLNDVKYVEMHTRSGGKADSTVVAVPSRCFGFCQWLGDFMGIASCMEKWSLTEEAVGTEYNERLLLVGVDMSPWSVRMVMKIHVTQDTSLSILTEFVALLQGNMAFSTESEEESDDPPHEETPKTSNKKTENSQENIAGPAGKNYQYSNPHLMRKKGSKDKANRENVYSEIQEDHAQAEVRLPIDTVQVPLPGHPGDTGTITSLRSARKSLDTTKTNVAGSDDGRAVLSKDTKDADVAEEDAPVAQDSEPIPTYTSDEEEELEAIYQAKRGKHTTYCACEKCLSASNGRKWETKVTADPEAVRFKLDQTDDKPATNRTSLKLERPDSGSDSDGVSCV